MFVPIILGTDKTTVSVATGQNDFHPLYLSIGNVQNHIRRAHKDALVSIGFLPIPKGFSLFYYTPFTYLTCYDRCEERHGHQRISTFQEEPVTSIDRNNLITVETLHDRSRHRRMP